MYQYAVRSISYCDFVSATTVMLSRIIYTLFNMGISWYINYELFQFTYYHKRISLQSKSLYLNCLIRRVYYIELLIIIHNNISIFFSRILVYSSRLGFCLYVTYHIIKLCFSFKSCFTIDFWCWKWSFKSLKNNWYVCKVKNYDTYVVIT